MSIDTRLTKFIESCACQDEIARTIKQLWISQQISLEEGNQLSEKWGIKGPLEYWN